MVHRGESEKERNTNSEHEAMNASIGCATLASKREQRT